MEKLEVSYPGLSGFDIDKLHITGELQAGGLSLIATDGRFSYQGLKSDIKSISLDVYMQADEQSHPNMDTDDGLSLDDLSLPITKLTGELPELSIDQLRLAIHTSTDLKTSKPLVFEIQGFKLLPDTDNNFHIRTNVGIENEPQIQGQLVLDVRPQSVTAKIRFPANHDSPPWMTATAEQQEQSGNTTTNVRVEFDADAANQRWLDELLVLHTGEILTHINGKLIAAARFAGEDQQDIEYLSLVAENLSVEALEGTMLLDAEILAVREEDVVTVTLPRNANIEYQDRTGKIDDLLKLAVPELRRSFQATAKAEVIIEETGTFVIQPGTDPSLKFNGDLNLNISSLDNSIGLETSDLQVGVEDVFSLESTTINGEFLVDWSEGKPISYSIDDGKAEALLLTADELHIQAQLILHDGEVLSTGEGKFINAQMMPSSTSVTKIDVTWQELDPINMVGKLTTRTEGFATVLEDETWTGFDLSTTYRLLGNANINGSGIVMFNTGPELPFDFDGNTRDKYWNIKLPESTIKLAELGGILHAGHYDLPESVKLSDGYIDIHGDIVVADEITASMTISGREMNASMLESTAHDASFSFNTNYGTTLSANGPVSVESISLAGGIDVSQLRADLSVENANTFSLKNLFAEVFEGQFNLAHLRIAEDRIEDTTLELTHINLGRLLEFVDISDLEGAGYLDFSLPAGSDPMGVFVKNGTFTSSGPGYLSYKNEGMAAGNIGLQAMENFQYEVLSGTLNYQSDGAYQIGIRLEGKNPDLYDGHPIVFNLNIGGSLPELFEALFITGDFEESILKQIRTK